MLKTIEFFKSAKINKMIICNDIFAKINAFLLIGRIKTNDLGDESCQIAKSQF